MKGLNHRFDSYARKLAAAPEEIVKEIEQEVIFAEIGRAHV